MHTRHYIYSFFLGGTKYLEVYWEVEEVVMPFEVPLYSFKHQILGVFVRNVADHQGTFANVEAFHLFF